MTEAMPFLQKTILLSYDPRPFSEGRFLCTAAAKPCGGEWDMIRCQEIRICRFVIWEMYFYIWAGKQIECSKRIGRE